MNATLKVKNFGPIKDVELDLRDVNVFIGPQASGKSVLAKLYTICKSPSLYCQGVDDMRNFENIDSGKAFLYFSHEMKSTKFFENLAKFSLGAFYNNKTIIEFDCSTHFLQFKDGDFNFIDKLANYEIPDTLENSTIKEFDNKLNAFRPISFYLESELSKTALIAHISSQNEINDETIELFRKKLNLWNNFRRLLYSIKCNYIPSERTLAVLLKKAALNLMHQRVPIPEHLLEFAANYNTATDKIKNLDLSYLKLSARYKNIDGEDFILDDDTTLKLSESASGLQSVVPLLITLENLKNSGEENAFHQAFVIEEPETNLFPKAQYALLKYLEKNRPNDEGKIDTGSVHIYTTHSPFILSSLNNMLYAYKKGNAASTKVQEEIAQILPKENWISPERFSAYQIVDGKAESIFDRESGLIQENIIDQISDDIIEDFRSIAIATMES